MLQHLAVTAPQVSAAGSVVTAIVAIVTGTVAILSFRSVKQDSRDRSRPLMVAELGPRPLSHAFIELLIRNAGQSAAREVHITFDPPLDGPEDIDGSKAMLSYIRARYAKPIPAIVPGVRLTNTYGIFHGDGSRNLQEPSPLDFTVHFAYTDDHGREYHDQYPVTVDTIFNETVATPGNTDDKGLKKRWAEALETIARGVGRT